MMTEQEYAADLIKRLRPLLPMTVTPGKALISNVRQEEDNPVKLKPRQKLRVDSCLYLGDEGGIACSYLLGNRVVVSSITHLKLDPKHPLYKEMRAYQLSRIDWLAQTKLRNDGLFSMD